MLLLLLLAVAFFLPGFLPYDLLYERAAAAAGKSHVSFFTSGYYRQMQMRCMLIGVIYLGMAMAGMLCKSWTQNWIERAIEDAGKFLASAIRALVRIRAKEWILMAYFIGFAALLRLPLLSQPMRYDEAFTFLTYASKPIYVALSFYTAPNNHVLHTVLVHFMYVLFGNQPWALRIPALLSRMALVPLTYVVARRFYGEAAAPLATGIVACSATLIDYSTNARGYSMLCFFSMCLLLLAAYLVSNHNVAGWVLLAVISALGFYTVPVMLYPFGTILIWIVLVMRSTTLQVQRKELFTLMLPAILITGILSFMLYSPVLAVSGLKPLVANKFVAPAPFEVLVRRFPASLVSTWKIWNVNFPLPVTYLLAAGFLISLFAGRRYSPFRVPVPYAFAMWVLPLLVLQRVVPFERVWLFVYPFFVVMAAAGVAWIMALLGRSLRFGKTAVFAAMTIAAVGISLWCGMRIRSSNWVYSTNEGRGMEAIAAFLKNQLHAGDSVLTAISSDAPLRYYLQKQGTSAACVNDRPSGRTFLVVNNVIGDSVQTVLAERATEKEASPPRLVRTYDSASLYETSISR